jgi:chondroitin AC lyase
VDNNESVQAVYNNNIKILQAIFYKAGEINYKKISLSVDKPCILLLKKSTNGSFLLSIADPTHLLKSINIQLNNKKIKCILPAGNFAGKT